MLQYKVTSIFSYSSVLLQCINAVMTSVVCIYIDILLWSPWPLACLAYCWDHLIATLSPSVVYVRTSSERIEAIGTIIDAPTVCLKCMPSVITAPLCMKFLIDLVAPWCVYPTLHSPILFIIVLLIIILWQSTMRVPFSRWWWYAWQWW